MNKLSQYLRLKDSHPTMQKLDKLFALAEELGISIAFNSYGVATVYDSKHGKDLPPFRMQDIDNPDYPMESLPPTLEFQVVYENPKYLEAARLEYTARKEQERLAAEARAESEKIAAEIRKKEQTASKIARLQAQLSFAQDELKKIQENEE